jgi:lipopolysaccharide transport system permease protein
MNSIVQFSQLVYIKVRLNLKSEVRRNYLSYFWWFLEPAMFVGVFYLIFGIFMSSNTSNFLVFLLCGQVPFLWFSRTLMNASASIEQGAGLMQQIKLKKIFFPLVTIFQDFFKSLCVFILFLLFLIASGYSPAFSWLMLPILILVQLLFIASLAIFVSMIVPFVPDLKFFVPTCVQVLMFASGIFYDYKLILLEKHHQYFLLNPMANLVEQYRLVIMEQSMPSILSLLGISLFSVVLIMLSIAFLNKFESHYPRLLTQ